MHCIETGEQATYDPCGLPTRERAFEFPHCGDGRVEGIEDVFQVRNTGCIRPKAPSAIRINFVDARVQNVEPSY